MVGRVRDAKVWECSEIPGLYSSETMYICMDIYLSFFLAKT